MFLFFFFLFLALVAWLPNQYWHHYMATLLATPLVVISDEVEICVFNFTTYFNTCYGSITKNAHYYYQHWLGGEQRFARTKYCTCSPSSAKTFKVQTRAFFFFLFFF